ncbi:hypothetical protein POJ06DRAFT_252510 [Lipomyces tetrasporus]|uniref:Uncharacterized protein n=1 Tax=Lipomyces tetrasporus TaxID=54092 RepID=A0AAD7QS48_9ASCO|nr:uncharacterized protein POJ06DRAFT_252510 [Lipomyces tetrasporus]KAJ8100379.1 hypothetical protein POJ06DRAFT_252510 [Lipomyces tetrasporus]
MKLRARYHVLCLSGAAGCVQVGELLSGLLLSVEPRGIHLSCHETRSWKRLTKMCLTRWRLTVGRPAHPEPWSAFLFACHVSLQFSSDHEMCIMCGEV